MPTRDNAGLPRDLTTAQMTNLIQQIIKRLKRLEEIVAECCATTISTSGYIRSTSNTGGPGSSKSTSGSSSGIGSARTSGTGSNTVSLF